MKKGLLWFVTILLTAAILAMLAAAFWGTAQGFLPVNMAGWETDDNGNRYYLSDEGIPFTGWQMIDGSYRYFDPATGIMATGWLELPTGRHYLGSNGAPLTGWQEIDGKRYCLDTYGSPLTGWVSNPDGTQLYLNENGNPHVGWLDTPEGRIFLNPDGSRYTGWMDSSEGRYYLNESGVVATGWTEIDGKMRYLDENGHPASGWLEIDGKRCYTLPDGTAASGPQEIDGKLYYLLEDGSAREPGWTEIEDRLCYILEDGSTARGRVEIDGEVWFFTSTGDQIYMVNPWNYLPEDYEVELVKLNNSRELAAECYDALMQMLDACKEAGHNPYLYSAYRTQAHQQVLFNNMLKQHGGNREAAAKIVAIPGTSEHQLGLAVDITDNTYRKLNTKQEETATQQWLMANCWDYGFIIRYPNNSSDITGIIYEPWHYRYVGLELAQEMKELGICLEEYLDMLTADGTTCGNPDYVPEEKSE